MSDEAINTFVSSQRHLLSLELQSESSSSSTTETSTSTTPLRNLDVSSTSVGLYGRTVVTFTLRSTTTESKPLLPAHRFTTGDDVDISNKQRKGRSTSGVISQITDRAISVALFARSFRLKDDNNNTNDDDDDDPLSSALTPPLTLSARSSIEIHKKILASLSELQKLGTNHPLASPIISMLFHPSTLPPSTPMKITPINPSLDQSQIDAVAFALSPSAPPLLTIHGPPGTGKTTTLIEFILHYLQIHPHHKILCTAPSNVAVDNLVQKLSQQHNNNKPLPMIRLGHPARIHPAIWPYSLESIIQSSDQKQIVHDVKRELQHHFQVLSNPKATRDQKRVSRREIAPLKAEIKSRDETLTKDVLNRTRIVLCTNVGAASHLLRDMSFDVLVMDEAAQALEASCWIPLLKARRVILAGDPFQLPPTVKSPKAAKELSRTLMERAWGLYSRDRISRMLCVQYRMNRLISDWASAALYESKLIPHESVRDWTLGDLPQFRRGKEEEVLMLIDTTGCGCQYEETSDTMSKFNTGEATIVSHRVTSLLDAGLQPHDMAIISPYNAQVDLLRCTLLPMYPTLEIKSVDGFQGGEKEAVILSLVRSNSMGDVGFLKERRRLNVAVTRAKKHLCVVGCVETVERDGFLGGLMRYMEEKGEVRSALEFEKEEVVEGVVEEGVVEKMLETLKVEEETKVDRRNRKNVTPDAKGVFESKQTNIKSQHAKSASSKPKQPPPPSDQTTNPTTKPPPSSAHSTSSSSSKPSPTHQQLMDRISDFAETASSLDDTLVLDPELSHRERIIVRELADQLNLNHSNENDRIVLQIRTRVAFKTVKTDEEDVDTKCDSAFRVLEDTESESETETSDESTKIQSDKNALLHSLAQERMEREKQQQQQQQKPPTKPKPKPKQTKSKQKTKSQPTPKQDNATMDDMDYLDAQIQAVQTSHGRTVEGTGSNYRTIINGMLISKPAKPSKPRDSRAKAALNAKLSKKEEERQKKKKKKKK